jgi:hypothetical protein
MLGKESLCVRRNNGRSYSDNYLQSRGGAHGLGYHRRDSSRHRSLGLFFQSRAPPSTVPSRIQFYRRVRTAFPCSVHFLGDANNTQAPDHPGVGAGRTCFSGAWNNRSRCRQDAVRCLGSCTRLERRRGKWKKGGLTSAANIFKKRNVVESGVQGADSEQRAMVRT